MPICNTTIGLMAPYIFYGPHNWISFTCDVRLIPKFLIQHYTVKVWVCRLLENMFTSFKDLISVKVQGICIRYLLSIACSMSTINLFVPNAPFLYPLKTSQKLQVFWCFQGIEKGCIGNICVKTIKIINLFQANIPFL